MELKGATQEREERATALLELSADPEFLKYIDPYPAFLESPARRVWRWELRGAHSYRSVWATDKWTKKGRRYYSDDRAEGALKLERTIYVLDQPFDAEEAEYRRLRLEGLSHQEIADRLGVALQTVKNHLSGIGAHTLHNPTYARDVLMAATACNAIWPESDTVRAVTHGTGLIEKFDRARIHRIDESECGGCVFPLCAESQGAQMKARAGG